MVDLGLVNWYVLCFVYEVVVFCVSILLGGSVAMWTYLGFIGEFFVCLSVGH